MSSSLTDIAGGRRALHAGRGGAALVELALAMPFLALVISLTFLAGYQMSNKQHVTTSARYAAWARVYGLPAPSDPELNAMFMDGKASSLSTSQGQGPTDTLDDAAAEADAAYQPAGELLRRTIDLSAPHSTLVAITGEFPSSIRAWQEFLGPRRSSSSRDGRQWQRGQVSYLEPVRDQFLYDLDRQVQDIQGQADPDSPTGRLSAALERLYSQQW